MLVFTILVARRLGETGLGQYAFIAAVVFVGNVFSTLGMDTLLIREIAAKHSTDTPTLTAALLIQLALSLLFILAVMVGGHWLPHQSPETVAALKWYSLSLLPLAFSTIYSAVLRAYERMGLVLIAQLVTAVFQTGGAFIILRQGGGLVALVWLLLGGQLIGAVVAGGLCGRFLPAFVYNWRLNRASLRQTMQAGITLAFLMVLAVIHQRMGIFTLSLLGGEALTGQFSAAARLVEAVKMVPYAFFGALFPVMARRWQSGEAANYSVTSLPRYLAAFTAVSALLLTILAEPLIQLLYGTGYTPAVNALRILGWSLIPFVFTLKLSFELVSAGQEAVALRAMAWTLGITAVLFTLFTQRWGLLGTCWAVTVSETVQAVILQRMRHSRKRSAGQPVS